MGKYIVTDLTRFTNRERVCVAVIDMETGRCLRPKPYFKSEGVEKLNMQPGAILQGDITLRADAKNPHTEDASHKNLKYVGAASGEEFKKYLTQTLSHSIASGFGIQFGPEQKHVPVSLGKKVSRSIITIKIQPKRLGIYENGYEPGKINANFTDGAGHAFRYLSITDRGFFDFAQKHRKDNALRKVRDFISVQEELYLRIGLGRIHKVSDGREGYWLQVNGIYTFPDFRADIRSC